jgi:hypothetical protein
MKEKSTDQLNETLKSTSPISFKKYLSTLPCAPTLQDYFASYIAIHKWNPADIVKNSHISKSYAHEILSGKKPHPSRDYLLSLCLGAHMDLDTTQHALRIAQLGELYSKVPRDAAIMLHINQKIWNIVTINLFLEEHHLEILCSKK